MRKVRISNLDKYFSMSLYERLEVYRDVVHSIADQLAKLYAADHVPHAGLYNK